MKDKISIREVAAMANVSIATVSRVINHKKGYSAETGELVKEIIRQKGYTPNMMAKGLRTNRNAIVGVLVPDIANEYFSGLVLALQNAFFKNGYLTMVCNSNETPDLEKSYLEALSGQKVSGIVLVSGAEANLKPLGIPTVYVGRKPRGSTGISKNIVFVESDNSEGGYLATRELLDKGCKNIVFLTDVLRGSSKMERYQGYCNALMEAGIELNPALILKAEHVSENAAKSAIFRVLDQGLPVDGVMCATDILAIGTIMALEERQIRVPEDIKVTGFDDISASRYFRTPVTTIHQYNDQMAETVSDLLLSLIEGEKMKDNYKVIPVTLKKRKSTE